MGFTLNFSKDHSGIASEFKKVTFVNDQNKENIFDWFIGTGLLGGYQMTVWRLAHNGSQ